MQMPRMTRGQVVAKVTNSFLPWTLELRLGTKLKSRLKILDLGRNMWTYNT